ncbi:MAG TPA: ChaB family protein [Acidimicrobiales bacterium]|jgi:cation transport regulator ChaB|nr:ChaB family protein [Acidimicrobiales bacterium]
MAGLSRSEREELPATLRRSPPKAQETFKATLESAEETYDSEQAAHRVAYGSLKHSFEKVGDHWEGKDGGAKGPSDRQSARRSGSAKRDRPVPTKGGVDANASKSHLMDLARRLDVAGRSTMNKEELVDAIDKANRSKTG